MTWNFPDKNQNLGVYLAGPYASCSQAGGPDPKMKLFQLFCEPTMRSTILMISVVLSLGLSASSAAQEKPVDGQRDQKGQHKYTNELAKESSPYLLMHAHNPVQWHGWNDATLAKAKTEDKPIFLSIGYSSCHWCHVMERESFLDEEIAKFLNENFICIKVDREERPDVDEIYMQALMETQRGSGGWPLSMFMMPDTKPFFGGTYWPARDGDRGARMGFLTIANKVVENYRNNRPAIQRDAEIITLRTKASLEGQNQSNGWPIQKSWSRQTLNNLSAEYDPQFGGFGFSASSPNRPKFPQPTNLFFLANKARQTNGQSNGQANAQHSANSAQQMLIASCERMMMGGVYDHLGGGFHRYSVDRYWKIPHFEKMLYDNGQLARVYSEVYELTQREEFRYVVEGILDFVTRELVAESGGIYSSLDAESEGVEGKFYRWELDEIKATLSDSEYELFASIYGLNDPPNFEGKYYAPQLNIKITDIAAQRSTDLAKLESELVPIRKKLFDVRAKRIRPLLDTKILTAWNGLMIRGFADGGRILKNPKYIQTAASAADFALANLVDKDGRLFRTHCDGEAKLNGYLIDYACLIDGLIALHRADGNQRWLDAAKRLQLKQDELFWDEKNGGYFYTSKDHETLLVRSKRVYDNAMPAGNSVAATNLLYLAEESNDSAMREKARKTVLSASSILTRAPQAAPWLVIAADELVQ